MNNVEVIQLRSVENERLKFRVIVGFNGTQYAVAGREAGEYEFNLPPISNYNMLAKLGALIIELNVPSAQTLQVAVPLAANVVTGGQAATGSGFKQFAQIRKVEVGDATGLSASSAVNVVNARMYAWEWTGHKQEPILCANPFGGQVKLTISTPAVDASTCWLVNQGAGAGSADIGEYSAQFTIEMVPSTNINTA